MAVSKSPKASSRPAWRPAKFINIPLDEAQKKAIKVFAWDTDRMDGMLEGLMQDGFKLTTRWDAKNGCYAAWLIAPDNHRFADHILAGRGSTAVKAVKQVLYIHHAILDGEWGVDQGRYNEELDD